MQFVNKNDLKQQYFDKINYIRLHKKIILLVKLVGVRARNLTEAFNKIEVKSLLKWKI